MLDKCPFCGSSEAPFLITYHGKDGWRDRYSVICSYNNGGCGAEGGWYHTKAEAIEHWNMRLSGWISVKDKLPNVGERVLVFGVSKLDWAKGRNVIAITSMSDYNIFDSRTKTDPYWISPWQYFMTDYEITHWMALPTEPKGENEDG